MSTSKQATVEDASPSPPPLPTEQPPLPTGQPPLPTEPVPGAVDEPIRSLGDGVSDDDDEEDEEEEEEEWDPSEERLPGQEGKKGTGKGKGKESRAGGEGGEEVKAHPWQAVWSAEKNAWYFWNTSTGEVTWTNPLEPSSSSGAPPLPAGPPPTVSGVGEPTFGGGGAGEMDPALAHLLPPEMRAGGTSSDGSQRALFNARTGRFTGGDYKYTVDHLDEYNRAKRMNSHYFDVDAWEREKQEEAAKRKWEEETGTGPSKKQITKKDMDRFRKKKAEKRARSQAWLRD